MFLRTMLRMLFVALLVDTSSAFSAEEQDVLRIEGLHAGEMLDVAVMIDARQQKGGANAARCRDGSRKDPEGQWVVRHTGASPLVIPLGNLLAPGACNSEIVVFSEKHKMHIERVRWTNQPGDVHTVKLEPRIKVPITLWTVSDDEEKEARSHINMAEELFAKNRAGIQFDPDFRRAPQELATRIASAVDKCGPAASIKRQGKWYIHGRLNVYYADGLPADDPGRNCAIKTSPPSCQASEDLSRYPRLDGNFTIVNSGTAPFTLAHELGHAFGLRPSWCHGHVNGLPPAFGHENIMFAGTHWPERRKMFTLGQIFRINTQVDRWGGTMLIANGLRPKTDGRRCRPNAWTDKCPRLDTNP